MWLGATEGWLVRSNNDCLLPIVDADVVLRHRTFPVRPPPAVQMLVLEDNRHQVSVEDTVDIARPGIEEEGPEGVITLVPQDA